MVFKTLHEYLGFSVLCPFVSLEILRRVLHVISQYNRNSCELILGAKGRSVSGIRTITARHLAMVLQSIQALQVVLNLLEPYIQILVGQSK